MFLAYVLVAAIDTSTPVEPPKSVASAVDSWQQALEQKRPCESTIDTDYSWYDKAHLKLSDQLCRQALWFDNFFSADNELSPKEATSLLWIRFNQRWNQRDGTTIKPRLRGVLDLPDTQKRLKLIIEGEDEGGSHQSSHQINSLDGERSSAAIRYRALDLRNWDFDLDVGIHFKGGPFTRGRASYYHSFNEHTVATLTQDIVVELREVWYETSRFRVDHIANGVGYRWLTQARYGQKTNGVQWYSWLSRTTPLDHRTALSTFIAVEGATEDEIERQSEIYRLGMHYRRSLWRPWFFAELEPQLTFPRHYDYKPTWQLSFNIEIQMGKSRKRGYFK